VTTYLTWRLVFAGEVVVVLAILAGVRWIHAAPVTRRPQLDVLGSVLSASGLALVVLGVLQSSSWGWIAPRSSPVTPFGFALTPFVIAAGLVLLYLFRSWERRREAAGRDPLVKLGLLKIPALRSGLSMLLAQNLILLGLFFIIPLYLQVVQGMNAFETGVRLLPVSISMLIASMSGPLLSRFAGPRRIVQVGTLILFGATIWLLGATDPELDELQFAIAMTVLGLGLGVLASQLGNVVQSSVGGEDRSEVGGMQYTAQNLGSSLGTALIGSILIGALAAAFSHHVMDDSRVSASVQEQIGVRLTAGISFVSTAQVSAALAEAGVPPAEAEAVVEGYEEAQLQGLKTGILAASAAALAALGFTRGLPNDRLPSGPGTAPGTQARVRPPGERAETSGPDRVRRKGGSAVD
jgi:Na+/melibiose symporter-like transporter